jgi:uncharacterized protein
VTTVLPTEITLIVFPATGTIIGFTAGFLGLQGAFLMVPVQYWVFSAGGLEPGLAMRLATGTSLAVMLPVALVSAWVHHRHGAVSQDLVTGMGAGVFFGALAGAGIASFLPGRILALLFGSFVIIGAMAMIRGPGAAAEHTARRDPALIIPLGILLGIVTGMTGIGGAIFVPVLALILGQTVHRAIGTANALVALGCAGSVIAYSAIGFGVRVLPEGSFGYINLVAFVLLAIPAVVVAWAGVRACHRLPQRLLRIVIAVAMAVIGLQMTGIFGLIGLIVFG